MEWLYTAIKSERLDEHNERIVDLQEGQESTTKIVGELKEKQSYQNQKVSSLEENLKVSDNIMKRIVCMMIKH